MYVLDESAFLRRPKLVRAHHRCFEGMPHDCGNIIIIMDISLQIDFTLEMEVPELSLGTVDVIYACDGGGSKNVD